MNYMPSILRQQAAELQRVTTDLVKRYQFRNRHESIARGVTVMQAYSLDAISTRGPLSMGELADELRVSRSAMTRVVDELEQKGLATRRPVPSDRRRWRIAPTARGKALWGRLSEESLHMDEAILATLSKRERAVLISSIRRLSVAIDEWREKAARPSPP